MKTEDLYLLIKCSSSKLHCASLKTVQKRYFMDVYGFKILWGFSSALTVWLHLHHSGHHSAWEHYTPSQLRLSSVCGYRRARCPDHSSLVLSPRGVHRSRSTAAEDECWVKLNNPDGRGSPTTVWSERRLLKTLRGRMLQDDAVRMWTTYFAAKKRMRLNTSHLLYHHINGWKCSQWLVQNF